jgi:hypothetical protein
MSPRALTFALGATIIVVANASALDGVAWNRSGEAGSRLALSPRELAGPAEWGASREDSSLALALNWRLPPTKLEREEHDNSRLFAIDVGTDVGALRGQYPERSRYLILAASLQMDLHHGRERTGDQRGTEHPGRPPHPCAACTARDVRGDAGAAAGCRPQRRGDDAVHRGRHRGAAARAMD